MRSWYLSSFFVVLSLILIFVLAPASLLLQPLTSNIAFAANTTNLNRTVPTAVLCPNTTFNVTINWTINATEVNSLLLTDYAPGGWSVTADKNWSTPVANETNVTGGKVEIIFYNSTLGQNFSARYQATVPASATPGTYNFTNGTLQYHINISGP